MIRQVELQDAKAITNIYNEYVLHSVATFDTEPVQHIFVVNICDRLCVLELHLSDHIPFILYSCRKNNVLEGK